jgi:hypothetical protein
MKRFTLALMTAALFSTAALAQTPPAPASTDAGKPAAEAGKDNKKHHGKHHKKDKDAGAAPASAPAGK